MKERQVPCADVRDLSIRPGVSDDHGGVLPRGRAFAEQPVGVLHHFLQRKMLFGQGAEGRTASGSSASTRPLPFPATSPSANGLECFGYRESPLEAMAYDAETAFANSAATFNVEKLVAEKLGL